METPNQNRIENRFSQQPLFFEVNPPPLDEKSEIIKQHQNYLIKLQNRVDVDAINLPEIQDEDKKGDKGERKSSHQDRVPPRDYAIELQDTINTDFIVNRVIVQEPVSKQEKWLLSTHDDYQIRNVVLVGGESSEIDYPGPSVTEGNTLIKDTLNKGRSTTGLSVDPPLEYLVGNIFISTRRRDKFDEPERMGAKIQSGCDFFTSQIVAEPKTPTKLLEDLGKHLKKNELPSPYLLWSFTPIGAQKDVNFLRWLGVEIPEYVEKSILEDENPFARSISWIENIWDEITKTERNLNVDIPMGINICPVAIRNYEKSIELADRLNS